jgi:hypothetical protein
LSREAERRDSMITKGEWRVNAKYYTPPPTEDGEIFAINARKCKRCGGILTSEQSVAEGYGHVCKMKTLSEEQARRPIDGQMTFGDIVGGEA